MDLHSNMEIYNVIILSSDFLKHSKYVGNIFTIPSILLKFWNENQGEVYTKTYSISPE